MTLDYAAVMAMTVRRTIRYTARDTMLYALGIGLGSDPGDPGTLPYVYERAGPRAVPSMACALAAGTEIVRRTGVDFRLVVHGEQRLTLHAELPPAGTLTAESRVQALIDKGAGRGAVLILETTLTDPAGAAIATNWFTAFCRGAGGFGGPTQGAAPIHALPQRSPDRVMQATTRADQALLYRLSGDHNPLHADPALAEQVGYARPILHGLCTYGIVCGQILRGWCGDDPARMAAFDTRFSNPVYPGETVTTEYWEDEGEISFRAGVKERGLLVLNNGRALVR